MVGKLMLLLGGSLLAGAALVQAPAQGAARPVASGAGTAIAADKPQIGSFGFDEAGMDRSIAPGDDFYGFANGTWAKSTPIPADKSTYGSFNILADLSRARTHEILEAQTKIPGSKMGVAYATYLDTATIENKGLDPVTPWLNRVKKLSNKADYPALVAEAKRMGVSGPFSSGVDQDDKNPEVYAVGLRQAGLGLPDRDYYLSNDAKLAAAKTAYEQHLAKMLTLAGEPNAGPRAAAIVAYETQIAQVSWTRIDSRDADKTYNKMTVAQLEKAAPGYGFAAYLRASGTPVDSVIVAQPSAVTGIAKLIADAPIAVLKDQLIVRLLDAYADVLPRAFDQERFAFYGTTLSGTPQQEERWKRAVTFTSDAVADDVGQLYVAKYFPPETKAAADQLVKNIIAAMNHRIDNLTWMAPETKVKAHAKLAAFTPKIGYPSRWHSYEALTITPGDAFGNKVRAAQ